jgi:septal ring factor EnvC (AmiA/AmiB activator)
MARPARERERRWWPLLLPLLLLLLWVGGSSRAQSSREADLSAIRQQIKALEERLGGLRAATRDLSAELRETEVRLELQEQRLLEAVAAREIATEKVEESGRRIEELEQELTAAQHGLRERLRGLYRLGGAGNLRLLLELDSQADPLEAVRILRYLARRDAAAVERYTAAQRQISDERQQLLQRQHEVEEWAAQEEARQRELAQVRRRQANLLARFQKERKELARRADSLKEKERKLSELLDRLVGSAEIGLEGTPIQSFRGVLDWPVEGRVVQGFGTVRDPRYQTRLPHNGLDLAVEGRQAVRAVYPGRVLFAGPFEGYGSMIVVLHPGRVFSIYTGLSQLEAGSGDVLSLNDIVGFATDQLYFEIRVEKHPEDPLEWLR